MKVETRKDALLHCFDLWLWLAVTGSSRKEEWPGWESVGGYLEVCSGNCPACEYSPTCNVCIINWSTTTCDETGGEFYNWCYSKTPQERTKWALKIAALALDAL